MTGAGHVIRAAPSPRPPDVPLWCTCCPQAANRAITRLRALPAVLHTLHMPYYDG